MFKKIHDDYAGIEDYTRVTEVLYPFSGLVDIDQAVVNNAANRGTRVHEICESIVKGFGAWNLDDDIKGYVESFQQWYQNIDVVCIEERFYCKDLMITGKVDLIIKTDVGNVILDLKTSYRPSKTWALQGSAYAYLANKAGYDIKGIQFLHLKKDGSKPKIFEYENEFEMYKKCLDVYRYFYEKKKTKK